MAFSWFRQKPKSGRLSTEEIACQLFFDAAIEYQIRELSFWTCVNRIANAIGRCDFRTYKNRKEVRTQEAYLWNVSPNPAQNSTAFWHKFVAKLCEDNEAIIVARHRGGGLDYVYVADDWDEPDDDPTKAQEFKKVKVGDYIFPSPVPASDVIYCKLHQKDMAQVTAGIFQSYYRLVDAAIKAYGWQNGQHWKVHVDQIKNGEKGWEDAFKKQIENQIKPFLENPNAVLPEFDGYTYTNEGGSGKQSSARTTRDIRALIDDIFTFTARGFGIPDVLITGSVADSKDATKRFLTDVIDPICDQLSEEITRKRYGYNAWSKGSYLRVDSSSIEHFDLFDAAASIEKIIGSGAFTINDILRASGQEPINEPWADKHYMTKNIGEIIALEGGSA